MKSVSSSAIASNSYELVPALIMGDEYDEEIWINSSIYTRKMDLTQEIYIHSILLFLWFPLHTQLGGMALTQVYRRKEVVRGSLP